MKSYLKSHYCVWGRKNNLDCLDASMPAWTPARFFLYLLIPLAVELVALKICINFGFTWSYAIHVSQSLHNFFFCLHEKSFQGLLDWAMCEKSDYWKCGNRVSIPGRNFLYPTDLINVLALFYMKHSNC